MRSDNVRLDGLPHRAIHVLSLGVSSPCADPPCDGGVGGHSEGVSIRPQHNLNGGDRARLGARGARRLGGCRAEGGDGSVSEPVRFDAVGPRGLSARLDQPQCLFASFDQAARDLELRDSLNDTPFGDVRGPPRAAYRVEAEISGSCGELDFDAFFAAYSYCCQLKKIVFAVSSLPRAALARHGFATSVGRSNLLGYYYYYLK